jgi:hypothetical protein
MPGVVAPLPLVEHHPCRIEDAVVAPSGSPRGARAVLPRQPRPSKRRQGAPRRPHCWLGVEGHSRTLAHAVLTCLATPDPTAKELLRRPRLAVSREGDLELAFDTGARLEAVRLEEGWEHEALPRRGGSVGGHS